MVYIGKLKEATSVPKKVLELLIFMCYSVYTVILSAILLPILVLNIRSTLLDGITC